MQTGPQTEHLAILRAATHETELGDHDFCLSRSYYTYTENRESEREREREKEREGDVTDRKIKRDRL